MILQRSLRVMQCGMILFLLVFLRHLGLTWRSRSFGIAFGFGLMAVSETILSQIGVRGGDDVSYTNLSLINMSVYNLAILTWFWYMLGTVEEQTAAGGRLKPARWEQGLSDIQSPLAEPSLIRRYEGIVDRAFSTTNSMGYPPTFASEGRVKPKDVA